MIFGVKSYNSNFILIILHPIYNVSKNSNRFVTPYQKKGERERRTGIHTVKQTAGTQFLNKQRYVYKYNL